MTVKGASKEALAAGLGPRRMGAVAQERGGEGLGPQDS